jgi:hypothetical protein
MPIQENPGPANQGPAITFAPTSIAGCALWLDGKDPAGTGTPPSTGATISTWVDKADAKNATATGSPTYLAGGGINFNGSAYFLNQVFTQNLSQRSIFIVMQETVRNNVYGVFTFIPTPSSGSDFGTTTGFSIETSNGLRFYGMNGSYHSDIGNTTLLVKAIYNDNMNGTAGSGFVNGTNVTNVNAGYTAGTCSGYGVAARWLGSISTSYALNGVIYEIIIFNTPLTLANRQNVEGYLAQKWGLTPSLPLGHPGLTTNYVASQPRIFRIGPLPGTRTPFVITANQPPPPLTLTTTTFAATGANQTFAVPATTSSVNVYMWGAAGGGGYVGGGNTAKAGAGAYVQGTLAVTPGATIRIVVGKGGIAGSQVTTYGGGGAGIPGNTCGSGGGRSAIQFTPGTDVVTVAGGGGGGYYNANGTGGWGDATTGTGRAGSAAAGGNAVYGGKGGTQSAGGAAGQENYGGNPTAGSLYQGGNGSTWSGAGGGGGYYGGGGGGAGEPIGGGGGGGSSLTTALTNFVGYNSSDGFSTPFAGTYNPSSIYGTAGGPGSTGGDGRVVLVYYQ